MVIISGAEPLYGYKQATLHLRVWYKHAITDTESVPMV